MTDWICPNCRGGFPEPNERVLMAAGPEREDKEFKEECPWCGQELGEYDPQKDRPTVRSVVEKDDTDTATLHSKLFGRD